MPGWKFVIGGGEKIKNQDLQDLQDSGNTSRAESANSGGGNGGMQNNGAMQNNGGSSGMQNNENRSMTQAVAYQPQQGGYANNGNGGNQMMASSNMMAGDYASQNNGGQGYGMFMPGHGLQNRQMGYLAPLPEWEDRSGQGGSGMRNDDDDDDDPVAGLKKLLKEGVEGKGFLQHLPKIFQTVFAVIAEPPSTWPPYLEKGDYSGIYVMEAKELIKAIEQYKAGQKGVADVLREMKHTGAALIQMYANLLQQMEEKK